MKYLASTVDSIFTPMVSTTHHNLLPGLDPKMGSSVVCLHCAAGMAVVACRTLVDESFATAIKSDFEKGLEL